MRPQYEHLTLSPGHSWQLLWRELPELPFLWHYHPEFELTLTLNARGQRYVGDQLADFTDGDLILLAQDELAQPLASVASASIAVDTQRQRMGRVLDYMHAHFQAALPVELLAERAALSVGAFHRFFKRHTQLTVTAYLAQLRIGSACQQLIQTDKAIGVIAQEAGYRNLAHFNRQFRAAKGVSPREFKQRYR